MSPKRFSLLARTLLPRPLGTTDDEVIEVAGPGLALRLPGCGLGSTRPRSGDPAPGDAHDLAGRLPRRLDRLTTALDRLVRTVEGDVEALNSRSRFDGIGLSARVSQDWQGSARARLGLAFDRWMVYGTGGVSFTEYERRVFAPGALSERLTSARTGWNVGAGVNFAFTDHLILGAEYRYTDFGRNRFASSGAFPGLTGSQELSSHSARASVAYKF